MMKQERDEGAAVTPLLLHGGETIVPLQGAADMIDTVDESKKYTAAKNLIDRLQREREVYVREMTSLREEQWTKNAQLYQIKTMMLEMIEVFQKIEEADGMPDYEYRRFVEFEVQGILERFGPESVPLSEEEKQMPAIPDWSDNDD